MWVSMQTVAILLPMVTLLVLLGSPETMIFLAHVAGQMVQMIPFPVVSVERTPLSSREPQF